MGRKMIKSMASSILSQSVSNGNGGNPEELEDEGIELLETEASLDYLCNLSPHRYPCSQLAKDFELFRNPHSSDYVAGMKPVMLISFQISCWVKHSLMNTRIMTIRSQ